MAAFGPKIKPAGHDYQFDATAGPGIAPATSTRFDISDVAVACSGSLLRLDQLGRHDRDGERQLQRRALVSPWVLDDADCNNAVNRNYVATSQTVSFDVTTGTGRTTIVMKLAAASVTKLFFKYEVCFKSPNSSFTNKYGAAIAAGQAGLLPLCLDHCDQPTGGPCVLFKWFDRYGNVYVKFSVPSGDPRAKM